MKRTLTLVVLAAMAVWAGLFFEPRKATKKSAAPAAEESAQAPTGEPVPSRPRPRPRPRLDDERGQPALAAKPSTATKPPVAPSSARSARSSGFFTGNGNATSIVQGAGAVQAQPSAQGETRERKVEPSGELGEGILSPDFVELETDYVNEHREGPWALAQEQRIRQKLYDAELAERIVIVHCQSSVCRLHFEAKGLDTYSELLQVPGLAEVTGLTEATPYSMNSTELIVYARPPALPEPEAKP